MQRGPKSVFTPHDKERILQEAEVRGENSISDIARQNNMATGTLRRWRKDKKGPSSWMRACLNKNMSHKEIKQLCLDPSKSTELVTNACRAV